MSPRQPAKRKLAKRNRKRLKEGIHLPTKGKAHRVWDTEQKGLYVNVQRSGTRSYRVIYRLGEQKREHSLQLGRFDEMHIDEARDRAREVRRAAAAGIDPTAKPVEPPNPFTFGDCIDKWIDYCQQGPSAGRTQKFMHSAFASWHGRLLSSLSYPEIEDFLHAYRKRAPQSANRLHLAAQEGLMDQASMLGLVFSCLLAIEVLRTLKWFDFKRLGNWPMYAMVTICVFSSGYWMYASRSFFTRMTASIQLRADDAARKEEADRRAKAEAECKKEVDALVKRRQTVYADHKKCIADWVQPSIWSTETAEQACQPKWQGFQALVQAVKIREASCKPSTK